MRQTKFIKKFLMPGGVCAAVPILQTETTAKDPSSVADNKTRESNLVRPSELPIYAAEEICTRPKICKDDCPPSFLEQGFGTVRKSVQELFSEYSKITEGLNNKINTGYEHSSLMLDYLREESNAMPRLGAVGIGGLTGLILSLRGGKFKRLVYTSAGALSVAAVCYPKEAKESFAVVKHYADIGYNFIYGVKPGDANQLEIKWPEMPKLKLPTSTSDFVDLANGFTSIMETLFGKVADVISDKKEIKDSLPETKPKEN